MVNETLYGFKCDNSVISVFMYENLLQPERLVQRIARRILPYQVENRMGWAVANLKNESVIISGGGDYNIQSMQDVVAFDLTSS